jgi:hypothetical protein
MPPVDQSVSSDLANGATEAFERWALLRGTTTDRDNPTKCMFAYQLPGEEEPTVVDIASTDLATLKITVVKLLQQWLDKYDYNWYDLLGPESVIKFAYLRYGLGDEVTVTGGWAEGMNMLQGRYIASLIAEAAGASPLDAPAPAEF